MNSKTPITVKQAAGLLGVSGGLVRRLLTKGKLSGLRVEGAVRVYRESVEEYINANEIVPPEPVAATGLGGTLSPVKQIRPRRKQNLPDGFRFVPRT